MGAIVRKHYGQKLALTPSYRRLRVAVRVAALVSILFVFLWLQFLSGVVGDIAKFNSSADGTLRMLQFLAFVGILGAIAAVVHAARTWSDRSIWRWTAVWNTLVAAVFIFYVAFVVNWHLLTPTLRY